MFFAAVITAFVAEGAYLPACVPLRPSCLPRRSAAVLLQASKFDGLIDELLAAPQEQVLSVMGQQLETIADGGFMAQLDRRRAAAGSTAEEQALVLLGGSVCDFMEELVQRMQEVAPELQEQEARAEASVAQAAQAAQASEAAKAAQVSLWSQMQKQPAAKPETRGAIDPRVDEDLQREQRAKNRFKVENLLDAARAGVEPLDLCLQGMRRELDEAFFEHLRWEVEQQVAAKNEKVLGILEIVIQRACVEAEAGHPEIELLAALLQTRNRELRQEMYQRKLSTAEEVVRRQFGASVQETQLRLEKDLLPRMVGKRRPGGGKSVPPAARGALPLAHDAPGLRSTERRLAGSEVDRDLLQQLRVIALEMQPFLKLDE